MEHLAPPDQVQEVVAAVRAAGRRPTVKGVCRVLVVDMGLGNSATTRALALAAVAALDLAASSETTLGHYLKPSVQAADHVEAQRVASRVAKAKARSTPDGREKSRAAGQANSRNNPLAKLVGSCRGRSAKRGHGRVDEVNLRELWGLARTGDTPWNGLLDFGAYGTQSDTGSAGSPFAPSFDRLDSGRGYVAGNVVLVPNIWNRTCNRYDRQLVLDLTARATRLLSEGRRDEADVKALRAARPYGSRLEMRLSRSCASVFGSHPALVSHRDEMMSRTIDALYGAGRGVCPVTGLAFSAEPGHPCFPSWDLVDHVLCGKRRYSGTGRAARVVSTSGGQETPSDMRLVCQFFNLGRCTFDDADWWRMADHVRKLVEAGVPT
jgi:hypothetical protein